MGTHPSLVTGQIIHDALDITGNGATCVVTGVRSLGVSNVPIDIGNFAMFAKELRGCVFGTLDPRADMPRLLGLYRLGLLDIDAMSPSVRCRRSSARANSLAARNVQGVLTIGSR